MVEGIDSGGEDGIYTFTKSQTMQEIMSDSKLAKVSSIIDEVMVLANKKSRKFSMGFEETFTANQMGAVDSMVFSDKAIQENNELFNDSNVSAIYEEGKEPFIEVGSEGIEENPCSSRCLINRDDP